MADDKEKKEKHEKNPFNKLSEGFGKFGALFKKKEDNAAFVEYKENFKKQRAIALHYNQVFQKYEDCLKDMVECQEKLHNVVQQTYEFDWAASYELKDYFRAASAEWDSYRKTFSELVVAQQSYLTKFEELKKKISYRRKKRDEYEQARKDLESKQQSKKPDQAKLVVAESDFKLRKSEFDKVNSELLTELPEFYESRTTFYQTNIGTLAKADQSLYGELLDYLRKAAVKFDGSNNSDDQKFRPAARHPSDASNPFAESTNSTATPTSIYPSVPKSESAKESPTPRHRLHAPPPPSNPPPDNRKSAVIAPPQHSPQPVNLTPSAPSKPPRISKLVDAVEEPAVVGDSPGNPFLSDDSDEAEETHELEKPVEKPHSSSSSSESKRESSEAVIPERSPREGRAVNHQTPSPTPPEVLRKVRASHKYAAIEEDELAFEKGDIIEVLPWLSEEDAEEGWLRGRREGDGKCGVFPENHTKPM